MTAGDILGAHRIVSLLGTGGMGTVWLAEHTTLGKRVAIKLLRSDLFEREDMVERFFDEARAAARVTDPGIVAVHDFGRHDGSAYIVMELLVGESLAARLARARRLPCEVAARLALEAAMTMSVAHGHGIVHRDLKPDNLFLVSDVAATGGERLKILDFGIAKLVAEQDVVSRTQTGAVLGTPMYMSPEQCRNARTVDHRTDIYALGCVLFQMVCGAPPFTGASSGDLIAAHLVDTPRSARSLEPSVSVALDEIIARCLRKAPDERFGSMLEVARALERCTNAVSRPPVDGRGAGSRSNDVLAGPGPAIGLLTTLATGAGETQRHPTERSPRPKLLVLGAVALSAAILGLVALRPTPEGNDAPPRSASPATPAPSPVSAPPAPSPPTRTPRVTAPTTETTTIEQPARVEPRTKPRVTGSSSLEKGGVERPRKSRKSPVTGAVRNTELDSGSARRDDGAYELDD